MGGMGRWRPVGGLERPGELLPSGVFLVGGTGSSWAFSAFAVPFTIALSFAHLRSSLSELGERERSISKSCSCLLFFTNAIKLTRLM